MTTLFSGYRFGLLHTEIMRRHQIARVTSQSIFFSGKLKHLYDKNANSISFVGVLINDKFIPRKKNIYWQFTSLFMGINNPKHPCRQPLTNLISYDIPFQLSYLTSPFVLLQGVHLTILVRRVASRVLLNVIIATVTLTLVNVLGVKTDIEVQNVEKVCIAVQ